MEFLRNIALHLNFLTALAGIGGSLYFSEVLELPPCTLCWYQRIFLYPLAAILGVALWTEDSGYRKYLYPLASIGFAIALYHSMLHWGVIAKPIVACTSEVSCSDKQWELFGIFSIPVLSLLSFAGMGFLAFFHRFEKEI